MIKNEADQDFLQAFLHHPISAWSSLMNTSILPDASGFAQELGNASVHEGREVDGLWAAAEGGQGSGSAVPNAAQLLPEWADAAVA